MDVSVIIVNYNTKDLTVNCIRSVYASKTGYAFEIILVDNASSDGTVDSVKTLFPGVHVIENRKNVGFAKANNQAAKIAKGRYLYVLNSDTEIEQDVIDRIVSFGDVNPDVGIIGTKIVLPDGKVQESYFKYPTFLSEFIFFTVSIIKSKDCFLFTLNKYGNYETDRLFEVDVITGCSMFVKQQVYKKVGLFNEDIFMYYEDVEFCHRVNKSGFKCMYFPEAIVHHFHMASSKKDKKDFKTLVYSFEGACIYFQHAQSRLKTGLFKKMCYLVWLNEFIILKLVSLILRDERVTRKIGMLQALLKKKEL